MSVTTVLALAILTTSASEAPAPARDGTKSAVAKGLKWLAEQQKADGHWSGQNDSYPTFVTGCAGAALLMEGSTLKQGAVVTIFCDSAAKYLSDRWWQETYDEAENWP